MMTTGFLWRGMIYREPTHEGCDVYMLQSRRITGKNLRITIMITITGLLINPTN